MGFLTRKESNKDHFGVDTDKVEDWDEEDKQAALERFGYKPLHAKFSQVVADDAFNAEQSPFVHRTVLKSDQLPS